MKTYEEYETTGHVYRKIGRPGEVHYVRRYTGYRAPGVWHDISSATYDLMRRAPLRHIGPIKMVNPMPKPVAVDVVVLEEFEGGNSRVYRKIRVGQTGGAAMTKVQSRPKHMQVWHYITTGRYEHMQLKWVGNRMGETSEETPQGSRIRADVAKLEEQVFKSNERAQFDRDAYNDLSNEFTKVEGERDKLQETLNAVRTQRDNNQVKLNSQPFRIKNAEFAQHQAEERLGEVARECADLKTRLQAAEHGWNHAEQGLTNANREEARLKGLVDVANARWEAFVDKVVSPPIAEKVVELQRVLTNRDLEVGRLMKANKKLRHDHKDLWHFRAEALRRMLKTARGGRLIAWASVDTYASKMEK